PRDKALRLTSHREPPRCPEPPVSPAQVDRNGMVGRVDVAGRQIEAAVAVEAARGDGERRIQRRKGNLLRERRARPVPPARQHRWKRITLWNARSRRPRETMA